MPPSAETRTFTGSVLSPMRTLGAGGADSKGPGGRVDGAAADRDRAGEEGGAPAEMTIADATAANRAKRPDTVIRDDTLSRRRRHFPAAGRAGEPLRRRNSARRAELVLNAPA